jgi:hypothetical protein
MKGAALEQLGLLVNGEASMASGRLLGWIRPSTTFPFAGRGHQLSPHLLAIHKASKFGSRIRAGSQALLLEPLSWALWEDSQGMGKGKMNTSLCLLNLEPEF